MKSDKNNNTNTKDFLAPIFFCGTTSQIDARPSRCWGLCVTYNQTHTHTHTHPVGLWTSEHLVAETTIYATHKTNTRDEQACPQRDWNPRSQRIELLQTYALDRRPAGSAVPIISINNLHKLLSETDFLSPIPTSLLMPLATDALLAGQLRHLEPTLYKVKSLRLVVGSPRPTVSKRKSRILIR